LILTFDEITALTSSEIRAVAAYEKAPAYDCKQGLRFYGALEQD
jgi:hypothetical protein